MTNFRTLSVAAALLGQAAMADPVTELRCTEAAWQQAAGTLQESRYDVWREIEVWLDRPAQASCDATPGPDGAFALRCGDGDAQLDTVLRFAPVDQARLRTIEGRILMLRLVQNLTSPEMTEAIEGLERDLNETLQGITDDLSEVGLTVTPIERAEPEEPEPDIAFEDILAELNPLQNSLGLTASMSWAEQTEDNLLARADDLVRVHALLQSIERAAVRSGTGGASQAAAAQAEVTGLIDQQADFWINAHLPLAASRFQLFDRPTEVVRSEADSISVMDIASWSQTSDAVGRMIEGVDEVVFFYEPQPGYAESVPDGADCKVLSTFPCPPLNSRAPEQMGALGDIPEGCDNADGCTFTTMRWVSEHVAVRTYLQASNAGMDDLAQFADRLTTLRTRALLQAFEPDAGFDPTTQCRI